MPAIPKNLRKERKKIAKLKVVSDPAEAAEDACVDAVGLRRAQSSRLGEDAQALGERADASGVDEGDGPAVVLFHGEPTWSYLWRKVIPPLVAAGHRCVAPDLAGFGRSDKPADPGWYSYDRHVALMGARLDGLGLRGTTAAARSTCGSRSSPRSGSRAWSSSTRGCPPAVSA